MLSPQDVMRVRMDGSGGEGESPLAYALTLHLSQRLLAGWGRLRQCSESCYLYWPSFFLRGEFLCHAR